MVRILVFEHGLCKILGSLAVAVSGWAMAEGISVGTRIAMCGW